MCNVRENDNVHSCPLFPKLSIQNVKVVLRTSRMRWFENVELSANWIFQVRKLVRFLQESWKPKKDLFVEIMLPCQIKLFTFQPLEIYQEYFRN